MFIWDFVSRVLKYRSCEKLVVLFCALRFRAVSIGNYSGSNYRRRNRIWKCRRIVWLHSRKHPCICLRIESLFELLCIEYSVYIHIYIFFSYNLNLNTIIVIVVIIRTTQL